MLNKRRALVFPLKTRGRITGSLSPAERLSQTPTAQSTSASVKAIVVTVEVTPEEQAQIALGLKLLAVRQSRLRYGDPEQTRELMKRFRQGSA